MYSKEFDKTLEAINAAREKNIAYEPRRMTAEEKEQLLASYHPDYKKEEFRELRIGKNKGEILPKELCDIVGLALFATLLGLTRTLYAKWGRNIWKMMFVGMMGAVVCYVAVSFVSSPIFAVVACVLTGCFTSMLWPGSLILMEERMPGLGVAAYALMAAGGDLGASVAPQLMGIIVDTVTNRLSTVVGFSADPEELGMRFGMLVAAIFPALGVVWLLIIKRYFKIGKKQS